MTPITAPILEHFIDCSNVLLPPTSTIISAPLLSVPGDFFPPIIIFFIINYKISFNIFQFSFYLIFDVVATT